MAESGTVGSGTVGSCERWVPRPKWEGRWPHVAFLVTMIRVAPTRKASILQFLAQGESSRRGSPDV